MMNYAIIELLTSYYLYDFNEWFNSHIFSPHTPLASFGNIFRSNFHQFAIIFSSYSHQFTIIFPLILIHFRIRDWSDSALGQVAQQARASCSLTSGFLDIDKNLVGPQKKRCFSQQNGSIFFWGSLGKSVWFCVSVCRGWWNHWIPGLNLVARPGQNE